MRGVEEWGWMEAVNLVGLASVLESWRMIRIAGFGGDKEGEGGDGG